MSCFLPKRKTSNGTENVKFSIEAIDGLQGQLNKKADLNACIPYYYISISGTSPLSSLRGAIISVSGSTDSTQVRAIRMSYYPSYIFLMSLGEPFAGNSLMDVSITDIGTLKAYRGVLSPNITINEFMSTYMPSLTTEATTLHGAINELNAKISDISTTPSELAMPIIRVANASCNNFNMIISETDPLTFSVEILDGKLQVGDKLQICTRQLFTYKKKLKRKYKLREVWHTDITDSNVNNKFITVSIAEGCRDEGQRLFKTGAQHRDKSTLSALYFRIRRPTLNSSGQEVGATFSNVVTVWKKYERSMSKIFIK